MATSEWLRFFADAGIPPGPALGYAVAFVDNRIHKDMLLELTRELMKELGVTAVGDAIAILRHAKVVHRQELCRAASESLRPPPALEGSPRDPRDPLGPPRDPRDPLGPPRDPRRDRAGAAGRMIAKSLSRDPARGIPGAGICVTVSNGGDGGPRAPPLPRRRRVTEAPRAGEGQEGTPRKILRETPERAPARPSVFERLGAETPAGKPSGVFSRLGEEPADPGERADPEGALPYAGVLKRRRPSPAQDGAVSSSVGSAGTRDRPPGSAGIRRDRAEGSAVSSSAPAEFRGAGSVFRRLGRKPD